MSVYVDSLVLHPPAKEAQARRVGARNGNRWCHMIADSPDELAAFAKRIGMRPEWLQRAGTAREHYDLTPGRREQAVALGAIELDWREMARKTLAKRGVFVAGTPAMEG